MKKLRKRFISVLTVIAIMMGIVSATEPMQVFAASNEQTIYDYLTKTMGFNTAIACGVLANIEKESGFDPTNSYMESDGYISYGICQWHKGRYDNLKSYCSKNGYSYSSLTGQLHFMEYELINSPGDTGSIYKYLTSINDDEHNNADGAYDAGYHWCYDNERPANKKASAEIRGKLAKDKYWSKYHTDYKLYMRYHANGGSLGSGSTYYFKNNDGIIWDSEDGSQWNNVWTIETRSEYGLINPGTFKLYRDGYTFKGWCMNADGKGTIYDPDDTSVIAETFYPDIKYQDGEITFYAVWEKNKVAFQYNANRGVLAENSEYYLDSDQNIVRKSDNAKNLNNWDIDTRSDSGLYNASTFKLTRPGHQFLGWSTRGIDKIFDQDDATVTAETFFPDIKTKSGSVLFYARWKENVLTVHYHANGGRVMEESPTYYEKDGVVYNKEDNTPRSNRYNYDKDVNFCNCTTVDIYRENYRFIGWSIKPEGGTVLGEDQIIKSQEVYPDLANGDKEINVYAQWEAVTPTVKLYENKSGINYLLGSDLAQYAGKTEKYGEVSTYTVDTESKHNGENIMSVNVLKDDDTLATRQFSMVSSLTGSVPYTGESAGQGKYYLSFYAKAPVNSAKIGARFGYSELKQSAEMTTEWKWYSFELDATTKTDQAIHFHFSKAGTYQLSHMMLTDAPVKEGAFTAEPETKAMTVLEASEAGSYEVLPNPTRTGYAFKGWFTQRSGGTQVLTPTQSKSAILYAQWEEKPLEITMHNGDKLSIADMFENIEEYSSVREKVAVVSKAGVITAVGEGNTTILLTKQDGSTSKIQLTVISANTPNGDITKDGFVDKKDVDALVEFIAQSNSEHVKAWKYGDMNGDGKLNAIDLTMLKRALLTQ